MSMPDNKYCPQCAMFEGENYDDVMNFRKKYGYYGCSGIPSSSGEFPYDSHAHCFTEGPLLTADESREKKIKAVTEIIKCRNNILEAAKYLVDRWDTI